MLRSSERERWSKRRIGQTSTRRDFLCPLSRGGKLRSLGVAGDIIPGNSDSVCSSPDGKCWVLLPSPQWGSRDFHFCAAVASRPCHEHSPRDRTCPSAWACLVLLPGLASVGLQLGLQGENMAEISQAYLCFLSIFLSGWHWRQGTGLDEPLVWYSRAPLISFIYSYYSKISYV